MADYPTSPVPSYSFGKQVQFKTLISAFENGAEQRRSKWSQGKTLFTLVYKAITFTEVGTLWAFYLARKGVFEAFTYVDPTVTSYTVRFLEDNLSFDEFSYQLVNTGVKLIQVL